MSGRRGQRGAGLFEFAVVAAVVALLAYLLVTGIDALQETSERVAFEQTVDSLEKALRYEASSRLARGATDTRDLLEQNPVRWLQSPPAGYLGELPGRLADRQRRGVWYYDRSVGQLVYRPQRHNRFQTDAAVGLEIRLRVESAEGGEPAFRLRPARPYTWR